MSRKLVIALLLMLPVWSVTAQEDTSQDRDRQYVTDQLRLSLYANPNGSGQIDLLRSGDLLEIEQVQGNYALVTTPDGKRGWVKRGFLVTKPTSNLLLAEEQQQVRGRFPNEKASLDPSFLAIWCGHERIVSLDLFDFEQITGPQQVDLPGAVGVGIKRQPKLVCHVLAVPVLAGVFLRGQRPRMQHQEQRDNEFSGH